jgi:H+/Cl- antiporter ClcA
MKFIAGPLQIGGGSSLGREGPCVQLAGTASLLLAGVAGEPKQSRRLAAATGAVAGLAAAFNAPLAGVTFAFEELIGDLNSRWLGSVLFGAIFIHSTARGGGGGNSGGCRVSTVGTWLASPPKEIDCCAGLAAARHRWIDLPGTGRAGVPS